MSVPVRYSAAAEYAVVDSGLENTLTQEEQYHLQQQQQQHQQQLQYQQQQQQLHQQQQQLEQQQQEYEAQYEQYEQQYQQEQEQARLLYCQLQLEAEEQAVRQQQQLMQQQRASMSSSGMPGLLDLPLNNNNNNINVATNLNNNNNMDAISINAILVDDEQPSTSAQAAAAALLVGKSGNGIGDATEMSTDWMRIANEGRYGTPGAAGLEYQKYEQQQQQTATLDTEAGNGATGGGSEPSSALKILEEKLHALSSDELYETLKEYDALQDKYHTVLLLPKESRVSWAKGHKGELFN